MAVDQPASRNGDAEVEEALAYLELLYGDAFEVGHDEQGYWAKPDGEDGEILRDGSPDGQPARLTNPSDHPVSAQCWFCPVPLRLGSYMQWDWRHAPVPAAKPAGEGA